MVPGPLMRLKTALYGVIYVFAIFQGEILAERDTPCFEQMIYPTDPPDSIPGILVVNHQNRFLGGLKHQDNKNSSFFQNI